MKLGQLKTLINAVAVTACSDEREITSGCACDLLSWVMAHGCGDMAWVTVQTPPDVIAKADEEGITVLESELDAFTICGMMYSGGVGGAPRK